MKEASSSLGGSASTDKRADKERRGRKPSADGAKRRRRRMRHRRSRSSHRRRHVVRHLGRRGHKNYKPGEIPPVTRKLNQIFGTIDPKRIEHPVFEELNKSFTVVGGFDEDIEHNEDLKHSREESNPLVNSMLRAQGDDSEEFDLILQSLATLRLKEMNWQPAKESNRAELKSSKLNKKKPLENVKRKPVPSVRWKEEIAEIRDDQKFPSNTIQLKKKHGKGDDKLLQKEKKKHKLEKRRAPESDSESAELSLDEGITEDEEDSEKVLSKSTKSKKKKSKTNAIDLSDLSEESSGEQDNPKKTKKKKKSKKKKKKKKAKDDDDSDESDSGDLGKEDTEDDIADLGSKKKKKKKSKKKRKGKDKDETDEDLGSDSADVAGDKDLAKADQKTEGKGEDDATTKEADKTKKEAERRATKLAALKEIAEKEEKEEEEMPEPDPDAEAEMDEGGEEQFGIQYDPDKQIVLGERLKKGQKVWAVDFSSGNKFRRGRIVGFEEPAMYTIRFGRFRKPQAQTQRLDIQPIRPKMGKSGGGGRSMFRKLPNVHKAAAKGELQTVLDNLVKNPDCIDKVGGPEKEKPLYYACKNGHEEVVKLLLRYGAEDEPDGRVLKDAAPEVREILLTFGWGKAGKFDE